MAHAAEMAESREKALTSELQLASQSLQQAKTHQQQLEISLNKSTRSLEQLQLSFQAEEVLYNEKILDAVHEVFITHPLEFTHVFFGIHVCKIHYVYLSFMYHPPRHQSCVHAPLIDHAPF